MPASKKELIFFEVNISHPCWLVDLTEKSKDAHGNTIRTLGIQNDNITSLVKIESLRIDKDIDFLRGHKLVKKLEVVTKTNKTALLKITSSYKAMTLKILHESGVTLLESPVTKEGADTELLLASSYNQLKNLVKNWEEQDWNIKLKRKKILEANKVNLDVFSKSGFFDLNSARDLLSERQREVFELACNQGYYDIPKKVSLEELAIQIGISPPTLSEHLRKAESKLIPLFFKVLKKI
ncbi:MAG: helix-turn-helix domain-containing protein [Candidatus Micrarchaeota archaeon]